MTVRKELEAPCFNHSPERTPPPDVHLHEGMLRAFFDQRPTVTLFVDAAGTVRAANRAACSLCDLPAFEVLGRPLWELPWGDDPDALERQFRVAADRVARGAKGCFDPGLRDPDGRGATRVLSLRGLPAADGAPELIVVEGREPVPRGRWRERWRLMNTIFESAAEAILITGADGAILDVNPAFTELTGYRRDEILGENPRIMRSGRHDPEFYRGMWTRLRESGHWRGEVWDRRKDGREFVKQLSISAVQGPGGAVSHYVGVFFDITPLKKAEARLRHLAYHDPLTALPNRALFFDRLRVALRARSRRACDVGVLYIDLDAFKEVNDHSGHCAGDDLLIEAARRLRSAVREGDTVARLGGDEFAVVLDGLKDQATAESVARRIVELLARPFPLKTGVARSSASVGVALGSRVGGEAERLVRAADRAMYYAKSHGKNQYRFHGCAPLSGESSHRFSNQALAAQDPGGPRDPAAPPKGRR